MNRFCILWVSPTGELRAFRYQTLVFGLAASPFILNCIIKYHVSQYSSDNVSDILNNNFYVDNLYYTGNDLEELTNIYNVSHGRMAEGGFTIVVLK